MMSERIGALHYIECSALTKDGVRTVFEASLIILTFGKFERYKNMDKLLNKFKKIMIFRLPLVLLSIKRNVLTKDAVKAVVTSSDLFLVTLLNMLTFFYSIFQTCRNVFVV